MQLLDRRTFLSLTAASAALAPLGSHASPQSADVFTSADGVLVDSTVVLGADRAVVIDAQLTTGAAGLLADTIAATGRSLDTIIITHAHPDHVLGLAVLLERFPDARPVAHPAIQSILAGAVGPMRDALANAFPGAIADTAVAPDALTADHVMLEGERIDVLDPMHGDTDLVTPVHIPALDTLVAADIVYADTHLWLAENTTPERTALWRASLDALEGIGASTIVPGHRQPDTPNDASTLAKTRAYLDQWDAAVAEAALRRTQAQGPTAPAYCTIHTTEILNDVSGLPTFRTTFWPQSLREQMARVPGVQDRYVYEDDVGKQIPVN